MVRREQGIKDWREKEGKGKSRKEDREGTKGRGEKRQGVERVKGERYGKGRGKNRLKMCILEITLKVFYAPSQTICFINLWFVGHTQLSSEHIHDCFRDHCWHGPTFLICCQWWNPGWLCSSLIFLAISLFSLFCKVSFKDMIK